MEPLFLANCIVCLISVAFVLRNTTHMFQLNGYEMRVHLRWQTKKHIAFGYCVFLFVAGGAELFIRTPVLYIANIIFYIILLLSNLPPKKAKKPFVVTERVKRLFVTEIVVCILVVWLAFVTEYYRYSLIVFLAAGSLFIVVLANTINTPIEKFVHYYFINDAKKILKANPQLIIIGVTGSFGKTSFKYFLYTLLRAQYNVLMTPESYNTPMGIAKTIREQLRPTHEIFICEMGAKYTNDIKKICNFVSPTHGVITSIGNQHLETFKTQENIIKAKFSLAEAVAEKGKEGMLFINGDDELICARQLHQPFTTYGINTTNMFYASDISLGSSGTTFIFHENGHDEVSLTTKLIGKHNVQNLAGAIAVSRFFGLSYEAIQLRLRHISPPPHRLQLSKTGDCILIDDSYNSNPAGCTAALNVLQLFEGLRIIITPGMVELGERQESLNRSFGEEIAGVCDFVFLVGEAQTKPIYEGLLLAGFDPSKIQVESGTAEALQQATRIKTEKERIILLENDLPDNY